MWNQTADHQNGGFCYIYGEPKLQAGASQQMSQFKYVTNSDPASPNIPSSSSSPSHHIYTSYKNTKTFSDVVDGPMFCFWLHSRWFSDTCLKNQESVFYLVVFASMLLWSRGSSLLDWKNNQTLPLGVRVCVHDVFLPLTPGAAGTGSITPGGHRGGGQTLIYFFVQVIIDLAVSELQQLLDELLMT